MASYYSPSPRPSREYSTTSSKFRENLSIRVPPSDFPIETSRFSPESPPSPPPRASIWTTTHTARSSTPSHSKESEKQDSVPAASPSSPSRLRRLFFDVRSLTRHTDPEIVPIEPPHTAAWPPLHIEKRKCCHDCPCQTLSKKQKRRRRFWLVVLIIVLLYLLGNTIFLDVRIIMPGTTGPTKKGINSSSSLSEDAQQCLSQYTVNAPSDPSGYPCSSCLSVLQAVPSDFYDGNAQDGQQIQNAIQFCGLRSVFETADGDGQSALKNGNWAQDVKFCAWNGVSCDGSGRVASLSLTFPGVPASLPNELGALTGLQSLTVIGNSAIPAGSLPDSFTSWTSLNTLHLESTGMKSLPDNLFSVTKSLSTLTLVKNGQMGSNLPSSVTSSSLQNLIVNGQNLANPLSTLSGSSSLQSSMKLIDLSSSSLSGTIPSSISSFTSLVELHLDSNNLATPLPTSFPSSLQTLTLSGNSGLTGAVSGSFCSLPNLQKCVATNTGLSAPGGCGVCQFSTSSS